MQLLALAVVALGGQAAASSLRRRGPDDLQREDRAGEAIGRLAAVEDQRASRVLCTLAGAQGQGTTTVRLNPTTNTRSLVFDNDAKGVETRVRCSGEPDPQCLSGVAPSSALSVDDCPRCPCASTRGGLFGQYAHAMADAVEQRCGGDKPTRVLMLGMGAGEVATHLSQRCGGANGTGAELEAVELDDRLPALAQRYFGLPPSVRVTVGDALPVSLALRQQIEGDQLLADQKKYDFVLVDCFSDGGVTPEHCRSSEFVHTLQALVRGGGRVMQHIWHADENHAEVAGEYAATVQLYKQVFGEGVEVTPMDGGPDSIIAANGPPADAGDI